MADEVATKADLQAITTDLEALEERVNQRIDSRVDALERRMLERMEAQEVRLLERIERSETRLLSEFRKWVVPFTARTRVFEATGFGLPERISLLEERVDGLENK